MTEAEAKLLNTVRRHEFQDALAYGKTRQGAFENDMLHLGHPLFAGGQDLTASDEGRGAAEIRNLNDGNTPLWLRLWRVYTRKLPRKGRAVLEALMTDWRTMPASKMASVSRPTVDFWKIKFKVHFDQCWRAYERDFVK